MRLKALVLAVATGLVTTVFATAAAANPWETEDIFGQGMGGPVVAADGAMIRRTDNGVTASVAMPTPVLAAEDIPQGGTSSGEEGFPAAFSLWVFIFFNPGECALDVCGPADLADPDVVGAGYNAGGHLVAGPNLNISGRVNPQSRPFGPGAIETIGQALDLGYTIAGAQIHLAVAPHGKLDPGLLPGQISTPAGTPSLWWIALFLDD